MTDAEHPPWQSRDERFSVFLHATVTTRDHSRSEIYRVRNISSGGIMAEGLVEFVAGEVIEIELRNIGIIRARVAWTHANRFGAMFDHHIDPKLVRRPVGHSHE